jgi:hypothetical protein
VDFKQSKGKYAFPESDPPLMALKSIQKTPKLSSHQPRPSLTGTAPPAVGGMAEERPSLAGSSGDGGDWLGRTSLGEQVKQLLFLAYINL